MTIEEIFRRGEISNYTLNLCLANRIKTFKDLKLYYLKNKTFTNLQFSSEASTAELIEVYNKYIDDEGAQPENMAKGEPNLEDVVTDLDEVVKVTLAAEGYLESLEQKLEEYWVEIENDRNEELSQSETPIPSVDDVVNSAEIEEAIKDYRREKARKEGAKRDAATAKSIKLKQRQEKRKRMEANRDAEKKNVESKSTFGRHPSERLNELYSIKSYQGANPVDAKVIFVGRDPNWAVDIEQKDMFGYVVEYMTDGVAFWNKYGVHHPFLLKGYKGDGRKYHRGFSRINLESSVASEVSFVELIGFPTKGMASANKALFNQHLLSPANKDNLILLDKVLNDPSKIIFIAWGLTDNFKQIYNKTGLLKKFADIDKRTMSRTQLNKVGNIYIHTHFSDAISGETIAEMEDVVREYLK